MCVALWNKEFSPFDQRSCPDFIYWNRRSIYNGTICFNCTHEEAKTMANRVLCLIAIVFAVQTQVAKLQVIIYS